jgi:hypothetical protein
MSWNVSPGRTPSAGAASIAAVPASTMTGVGQAPLQGAEFLGEQTEKLVLGARLDVERNDELQVRRQPTRLAVLPVGVWRAAAVAGVVDDDGVVARGVRDQRLECIENPLPRRVLRGEGIDPVKPSVLEQAPHQREVGVAAGEPEGLTGDQERLPYRCHATSWNVGSP